MKDEKARDAIMTIAARIQVECAHMGSTPEEMTQEQLRHNQALMDEFTEITKLLNED